MFFLEEGDSLSSTIIQAEDRIRVRPQLGKFFVWRPVKRPVTVTIAGFEFKIFSVRRAIRLWTQDAQGAFHHWMPIPKGKGDVLSRIINDHGREHFRPPGIRWIEVEPAFAVDGRFDYVAVALTTNS